MRNTPVLFLAVFTALFILCAAAFASGSNDQPSFVLSGVVKNIDQTSMEVYQPNINKKITVNILPDTTIINRLDDQKKPYQMGIIRINDLVVVNGTVEKNLFRTKSISYLPME